MDLHFREKPEDTVHIVPAKSSPETHYHSNPRVYLYQTLQVRFPRWREEERRLVPVTQQ